MDCYYEDEIFKVKKFYIYIKCISVSCSGVISFYQNKVEVVGKTGCLMKHCHIVTYV